MSFRTGRFAGHIPCNLSANSKYLIESVVRRKGVKQFARYTIVIAPANNNHGRWNKLLAFSIQYNGGISSAHNDHLGIIRSR